MKGRGRGCRDRANRVWHAGGGGRVQLSENMLHVTPNVNDDMIRLELKWECRLGEYDCDECPLDVCPSDLKHANPLHSKLRLTTALLPPSVWYCSFNPAIFNLTGGLILAGIWVTKPDDLQAVKRLLM